MIIYNNIVNNIKVYKHGYQSINKNITKLNANESPFKPSLKIIKNLLKEIKFFGNILKFYPDPDSLNLKLTISKYYNIKQEEIFVGNGSDEVLAHTFLLFFKNRKKLYIQDITYSFYESYIKLYRIEYVLLELNENFSMKKKLLKNIDGNILITNPNAPTGKLVSRTEIEKIIINNKKSLILIDEAYIDFSKNKYSQKLMKKYKNVLICQTLSKSRCLAGVRIGFIMGNEEFIKNLNKVKNSFNTYPVNILNQKIINCLYKNNLEFEKNIKILKKNKKFLIKNLKKLNFKILNSEANFLLIKNENINSNNLIKKLKSKNIFIRKFEIPKLENYLRITIGNKINCKLLISNIKKLTPLK